MPNGGFPFNRAAGSPGRRQAARVRLALPGKVILITGHHACLLEDLSQTGARVTVSGTPPRVGDDVVLMVNGVEAFGTVVWQSGAGVGLCFEQPMAIDDVVRLRNIHDHYQLLEQQAERRRAREFVQGRKIY
jgi:hypothetical protein